MRRNFQHSVPTMFKLSTETEALLKSLPTEFSKKEFEEIRDKVWHNHPLSFQTCRGYGFIGVVRQEPAIYTTTEDVWVDAKGRKFTYEEMKLFDRWALVELFNCSHQQASSIFNLDHGEEKVEHPCYRNIFSVDWEKFWGYAK